MGVNQGLKCDEFLKSGINPSAVTAQTGNMNIPALKMQLHISCASLTRLPWRSRREKLVWDLQSRCGSGARFYMLGQRLQTMSS